MPQHFLATRYIAHHTEPMLVLRRTMKSSTSGEWSDQEFDVFDNDTLVGHILRSHSASADRPWLWTITSRHSGSAESRGFAKSLESAMSALTSQWESIG